MTELCSRGRLGDPPPAQPPLPLHLEQLEALAIGEAFSAGVALLDFTDPVDLAAWLAAHAG